MSEICTKQRLISHALNLLNLLKVNLLQDCFTGAFLTLTHFIQFWSYKDPETTLQLKLKEHPDINLILWTNYLIKLSLNSRLHFWSRYTSLNTQKWAQKIEQHSSFFFYQTVITFLVWNLSKVGHPQRLPLNQVQYGWRKAWRNHEKTCNCFLNLDALHLLLFDHTIDPKPCLYVVQNFWFKFEIAIDGKLACYRKIFTCSVAKKTIKTKCYYKKFSPDLTKKLQNKIFCPSRTSWIRYLSYSFLFNAPFKYMLTEKKTGFLTFSGDIYMEYWQKTC